MNDAEIELWGKERSGGKRRYVWRNAIVWSVSYATLYLFGQVLWNIIRPTSGHTWIGLIGWWFYVAGFMLVALVVWLSIKWDRREARYRMSREDDQEIGHSEWI